MSNALIAIAVVGLVIYRQVVPRQVGDSSMRLMAILGIIGVIDVAESLHKVSTAAATDGILAIIGALAIGTALGVARAYTVRLWRAEDGTIWRRGGVATVALWLVAMAAHIGLDVAVSGVKGAGTVTGASVLLFIALSFGVQSEVARWRAARIFGPQASASRQGTSILG